MNRKVFASALMLSGLILAGPGPAAAACQLQKMVEVPITMEDLRPTLMGKINGQDAKFLVDTGAFFSGVTADTAARYKMKRSITPFGMEVQGVGGVKRDLQAVAAQSFTFAGASFHDTDFILLGRVGGEGIVGNIGENLMGPFEVEYDFGNGVMRYFKATGCGDANLAYWSAGMALSRLSVIDPTKILTRVITNAKVNGSTIRVMFDSGSSLSVLSRNAAGRAGVQLGSEGVVNGGTSYGIYGKGLDSFLAPFASFKIGDEEIKNTRLRVANIELLDSDMLLGADFFLSHRIMISNSQKKVYFTYNGGPVFRLDQSRPQQQAQATPGVAVPTAGAPPPANAATPQTAAEFARRGSAFASRREFQLAIADDSRAIELEPDNASYYRARASARLGARQPILAMSDLDEALKRRPNDVETLMLRGQLFLSTRNPERAKADFEAAIQLAPDNPDLAAEAGTAYARAGLFEPAIQQLDTWIAAHPKSEDLPRAQAARCWTRAAWGKELPAALADCDAALRRDKTSEVMATRGLVLLRMDRLDEAIVQYTAAIRLQPQLAPALYGRGLAELKKGARAEGDTDIAAAKAIAPGLLQEYKRLGITPAETPAPAAKS